VLRRFGDALLVLGLVVGLGSIVGYQLDIIPTLPPALLKLVLYKLIFVGALGLLVAGAIIRRLTNPEARHQSSLKENEPPALNSPPPAVAATRSTARSKDVL
jgi:vacuolar-type H+-ATPase subunit I/STV1